MSIARAFTTRRAKQSLDMRDSANGFPQRSNTSAKAAVSIRNKISAPVELIHTTNMLSYNAPDLFPVKTEHSPSSSSTKSDDESDTASKTASTPPTSPDTPYPDKRATSPEPNHLSCYFTAPTQAVAGATAPTEVPAIPQRAPSHTKKSYEGLTRHRSTSRLSEQSQRSVSTKASFTFSRSSSSSTSTSTTSVSHNSLPHPPKPATTLAPPLPIATVSAPPVSHKKEYSETHPFGHELAQVSELAEEYGAKDKLSVMEQEEQDLLQRGLRKFSAEDYLSEIRGLAGSIFDSARPVAAAMWI